MQLDAVVRSMQTRWTRLQNDLHCVGWGVKLYSLTQLGEQRRPEKLSRRQSTTV